MVNQGNQVTLFAPGFKDSIGREIIDGVEIVRGGGKYSVYWEAKKYYKKYFSKEKYDVVVDQINTIPFFTPLYVKEKKVSVIYQITGDVYFRIFPFPLNFLVYKIEPKILKLYKKLPVIVLSDSVKEELVKIGFPSDNIGVVCPGIEYKKFQVASKTPYPSVLYMNRVVKYKNVDDLIRAFSLVKKNVPDARLSIAGCRGTKYVKSLKKLVDDLDLIDVKFHPFITGPPKEKLLKSSWVHVLPSTKEGWGISVIEAAARGTPTVGYDVCGLKSSVRNNETGLLVESRNIDELAEAIERTLLDDELRKKFSNNSMEYAKNFSWEGSSKSFLAFLRSLSKG